MENKTPRHRHTPSDPRAQQRNVIDGRPIPRRRSSSPASSASDGYFDRSRISADDAAHVSRNSTQKSYQPNPDPSRQMPSWAQQQMPRSTRANQSRQGTRRQQQPNYRQSESSRLQREQVGEYHEPFVEQPSESFAAQEPLQNQPSWYDPNRANSSRTPAQRLIPASKTLAGTLAMKTTYT